MSNNVVFLLKAGNKFDIDITYTLYNERKKPCETNWKSFAFYPTFSHDFSTIFTVIRFNKNFQNIANELLYLFDPHDAIYLSVQPQYMRSRKCDNHTQSPLQQKSMYSACLAQVIGYIFFFFWRNHLVWEPEKYQPTYVTIIPSLPYSKNSLTPSVESQWYIRSSCTANQHENQKCGNHTQYPLQQKCWTTRGYLAACEILFQHIINL